MMFGLRPWSRADEADAQRKEIPDPHHTEEIAMLARWLADPVGISPHGISNMRERLEYLRQHAPFFAG
jgi:hypothetical protein